MWQPCCCGKLCSVPVLNFPAFWISFSTEFLQLFSQAYMSDITWPSAYYNEPVMDYMLGQCVFRALLDIMLWFALARQVVNSHLVYLEYWTNVGLMLAHRLRRCANIKPTLVHCIMFATQLVYLRHWPGPEWVHPVTNNHRAVLLTKVKTRYLLTCNVNRYRLLALHDSVLII